MKIFFCALLSLLLCGFLFAENPENTLSIKEHMDYLDAMQNAIESETGIKKITSERFKAFFSLDNINKGSLHKAVKENDHASLLVFFLALGGLVLLLYGYKILPLLIMIFGVCLGFFATSYICDRFFSLSHDELILFLIIGVLITAVTSLLLRTIFLCLFGAAFGGFFSQLIMALCSFDITNRLLFMALMAILFAVTVLLLKRLFMIVLTSLIGSLLLVFSSQYLVLELFKNLSYTDQLFNFTSIVVFLISIISGLFFQFKTTKKM